MGILENIFGKKMILSAACVWVIVYLVSECWDLPTAKADEKIFAACVGMAAIAVIGSLHAWSQGYADGKSMKYHPGGGAEEPKP